MEVLWLNTIFWCFIVLSVASNMASSDNKVFKRENGCYYKRKTNNACQTYNPSKIFSELFWTKDKIKNLRNKNRNDNDGDLNIGKILTYKTIWRFIDTDTINRCSKGKHRRLRYCSPCCQTEWSADVPKTIEFKNTTYKVIQPPDGYQVIFKGSCKYKTTCTYGKCKEENSYFTYVLVEDLSLNTFPPVKFVPISFPRMCHCVNIT